MFENRGKSGLALNVLLAEMNKAEQKHKIDERMKEIPNRANYIRLRLNEDKFKDFSFEDIESAIEEICKNKERIALIELNEKDIEISWFEQSRDFPVTEVEFGLDNPNKIDYEIIDDGSIYYQTELAELRENGFNLKVWKYDADAEVWKVETKIFRKTVKE